MILIEEYIQKPKIERQAHLRLKESCQERGGDSHQCRGLLAYILDTTIPKGKKIACCHACHNAKCNNPYHLYWGTYQENYQDAIANGKKKPNIHENMIRKYGVEGTYKILHTNMSKLGKNTDYKVRVQSEEQKRNTSLAMKKWWAKRKQEDGQDGNVAVC